MLVLSRKPNQSIHIGANILVSVVRIKGNVIQLGIEAPKDVRVLRAELIERDAKAAKKILPMLSNTERPSSETIGEAEAEESADSDSAKTREALFAALRVISESADTPQNRYGRRNQLQQPQEACSRGEKRSRSSNWHVL